MRKTNASRSLGRGLAQLEPEAGTLVVYAAKHGHTASDGQLEHSPFAQAFLNNIIQPNIEVRKLFDLIRDDVMTQTFKRTTALRLWFSFRSPGFLLCAECGDAGKQVIKGIHRNSGKPVGREHEKWERKSFQSSDRHQSGHHTYRGLCFHAKTTRGEVRCKSICLASFCNFICPLTASSAIRGSIRSMAQIHRFRRCSNFFRLRGDAHQQLRRCAIGETASPIQSFTACLIAHSTVGGPCQAGVKPP